MLVGLLVKASSVRIFDPARVLNSNRPLTCIAAIELKLCGCIPYLIEISFIEYGQRLHDQLNCEGWAEEFRIVLLAVPQGELAEELSISLRSLNFSARHPESLSGWHSTNFNDHWFFGLLEAEAGVLRPTSLAHILDSECPCID